MFKIAFFTSDWNCELIEGTMKGLKRYIDAHDDVRVCVFDCFGKGQHTLKDQNEYGIYDLAHLECFDGLIVQGNQILLPEVRAKIAKRIAEKGIPAVSVDCPIPGCDMIGVDNYTAQYDMVDHVIRRHGARRLVHISGILDNGSPSGNQRRDAFLNACRDNHLDLKDCTVIPCTWRTGDAKAIAQRWLKDAHPLPDAFICANDEMALGVIDVLQGAGYAVPTDVIVTGFDNFSSAELVRPRLSTIDRDYSALNAYALDVLIQKIRDKKQSEDATLFYRHTLICSESCGCQKGIDESGVLKKYYNQTRFIREYYAQQSNLSEKLIKSPDLKALMQNVADNQQILGSSCLYLCVNDYYYDECDKALWAPDSTLLSRHMVMLSPDGEVQRFLTEALLPESIMEKARFLVFYPLFYDTYSIGYLVMDSYSEVMKLNLHESLISFLAMSIDNVRRKCVLRQMNDRLDDLYMRDALTGLYNRFGYDRFAQKTYEGFLKREGSAQVVFIDLDDMKGINDTFGHDVGDLAIQAAAEAIHSVCAPEDFAMRYGGDEFMLIASGHRESIAAEIQKAAALQSLPAGLTLKVSSGRAVISSNQGHSLNMAIQSADEQMYEVKKRNKVKRQGNPNAFPSGVTAAQLPAR